MGGAQTPRVGWVSVDQADNDPAVLLCYIATAVDRVESIDPRVLSALTAPAVSLAAMVVPRIAAAVATMRRSVALVLDHVELLANVQSLDAIAALAVQLPSGSQLALGSRTRPPLPEGLPRAGPHGGGRGRGAGDGPAGGPRAAGRVGVRLAEAEVAELVGRTEGWPVGLYLAALARKAGGPRRTTRAGFAGNHRLMTGYLPAGGAAGPPPQVVSLPPPAPRAAHRRAPPARTRGGATAARPRGRMV